MNKLMISGLLAVVLVLGFGLSLNAGMLSLEEMQKINAGYNREEIQLYKCDQTRSCGTGTTCEPVWYGLCCCCTSPNLADCPTCPVRCPEQICDYRELIGYRETIKNGNTFFGCSEGGTIMYGKCYNNYTLCGTSIVHAPAPNNCQGEVISVHNNYAAGCLP